jgi:uncharacterized protein (DUF58 family)
MEAIDRRVSSLFIIPLVLIFVGVLLFIALLYGQRDLTILSLMLFGLVVGAKLWTRWSLTGIDCRLSVDKSKAFPGEKLILRATAENRKLLPVWLQVKVPFGGLTYGVPADSSASHVAVETSLLWYQSTRFEWELTAQGRGAHRIGPLAIMSGDLFGFFPKGKELTRSIEVIVYPRLVPVRMPSLPRRDFFGIPGAENPVKDPVYILGTRDYQQGGPAKYIHWKATARHHRLQEKIFEPTEQEKMLLVVDVGQFASHTAEEEFERALEIVASVAVLLDGRGCSVGLVTNGLMAGRGQPILPVTKNPQQLRALLEALARLRMEAARDLTDTMRVHLRVPWGTSCLYFAREKDASTEACREFFARRRIPVLFFLSRVCSSSGEYGSARADTGYSFDEVRIVGSRS